ncbi:alpha/beta hydrolase [uncultured Shewanella sp.]|uniref:alpha/beta hydrolase n=1 Tax=uncultured Shewanella sp. TaxID=173975 RepID=UPI00260413AF|nr:alpha/beta hydrolase [uncultured Shewanella sp.]
MKPQRIYDPEIEAIAKILPYFDFSDPNKVRESFHQMRKMLQEQGIERPTDENVEEVERSIPGANGAPDIPIRLYRPKAVKTPMPVFINFHGGGFMLGDLEFDHPRSLVMAARTQSMGVLVDYRLLPEHPFPAAVEDCYATLEWVSENAKALNIDPNRIVIGGGSAGGTLAAAVALMARDRKGPNILMQMLLYPALDDQAQTESMKNGDGLYICDNRSIRAVWCHYLGMTCLEGDNVERKKLDSQRRDGLTHNSVNHNGMSGHSLGGIDLQDELTHISPYAAPGKAKDLSKLPPAYIMTCEHDALRDEAILYATRLMNAGVPVELHNYAGTVHGFDFLTPSSLSEQAIEDCVRAFKRACQ